MGDSCHSGNCGTVPEGERRLLKLAIGLSGLTVGYNLVEAGLAVYFGVEAESIALLGFGLDSLIEVSAALMLLWRLILQWRAASVARVENAEQRVYRFVGITFLLLTGYIWLESGSQLLNLEAPQPSVPGIILAILSVLIMPALAWAKISVGKRLNSEAMRMEAKETLACSFLSLFLLAGLALNATVGWWWADPVSALAMTPWLLREGLQALKGESCCG
jgi:divalent metal cation (Fe/Co/Zn/Cd) transporter